VEEGDLAADKSTAAALGGWIVFEDECGQSLRPPRSATWGRRGITPVIRVRGGGTGHVSVAGLACYRPGDRSRLIYRLHCYRGRKGETKAFTWTEYRDLLIAAHRQLPGGVIMLVWDNLNVHRRAELRAFTDAQAWLRVFRLPAYAPDLNPVEGIWPVLKGGVLANLAVASFGHLVQVIRHGLRKVQYRPGLIEGCLAGGHRPPGHPLPRRRPVPRRPDPGIDQDLPAEPRLSLRDHNCPRRDAQRHGQDPGRPGAIPHAELSRTRPPRAHVALSA
jgi:hypothetical protein